MAANQYGGFPITFHANPNELEAAKKLAASGKARIILGALTDGIMPLVYSFAVASVDRMRSVVIWTVVTLLVGIGAMILLITGIVACAKGNVIANRYRSSSITLYTDRISGTSFPTENASGRSFTIPYTAVERAVAHGHHGLNLTIRTTDHSVYHGLSIVDAEQAAGKIMAMKAKLTPTALPLVSGSCICPQCGAVLPEDSKFCNQCAHRIAQPPLPEATAEEQSAAVITSAGPVMPLIENNKLTCPVCGTSGMRANRKFCERCSAEFVCRPWICSHCGRENYFRTNACFSCGSKASW